MNFWILFRTYALMLVAIDHNRAYIFSISRARRFNTNHQIRLFEKKPSLLQDISDKTSEIEWLVFSGGGAKGAGLFGTVNAFFDANVMDSVQSVTGSSVGALTAALIAVGINPEYFNHEVMSLDINALVSRRVFTGPNIIPLITSSTDPLESWINRLLLKATSDFLKTQSCIPDAVQNIIATTDHQLTFGELEILHQVYPKQFKRLYIPAAILGNGSVDVFDYHTKHVSIARACAASAAIPGKFSPVKIDSTYYQDAVLSDLLPVDSCLDKTDASKVVLLLFQNRVWQELIYNKTNLSWQQLQYDIDVVDQYYMPFINTSFRILNLNMFFLKLLNFIVSLPVSLFALNARLIQQRYAELVDIATYLSKRPVAFSQREVAHRVYTTLRDGYMNQTVLLDSGSIGTLDFENAQEHIKEMQAVYYLNTMLFLIQNNIYHGAVFKNTDAFYTAVIECCRRILVSREFGNHSSAVSHYKTLIHQASSNFSSVEAAALVEVEQLVRNLHQKSCALLRPNRYRLFNITGPISEAADNGASKRCKPH